jgi:phosphopantothenoylcysteine decarboxylase / phosphopantothenate---cysteine ligase
MTLMKILVGISGSIAAYRSPDFVKELRSQGHEVRVVLTASAAQFVSTKVLETFAGNKVAGPDVFDQELLGTDHIAWARWADEVVVYGATATTLSRLARASGEDFLSLQLLAFEGRPILVPAMNTSMWKNPLVQENVEKLRQAGYRFVGPIAGLLACGESGVGHIASHDSILGALLESDRTSKNSREDSLSETSFKGLRVLVSGGPMRTPVDPVRFLQNRSSGEMAVNLIEALTRAGALVTAVLGPIDSALLERARSLADKTFRFETYADYSIHMEREFANCDLLFSAAAVLDFEVEAQKTKQSRQELSQSREWPLPITPTEDVVSDLAHHKKTHQKIVAFSLESGPMKEVIEKAAKKLRAKKVDWIIANRAEEMFSEDTPDFEICILSSDGTRQSIQQKSKKELSTEIVSYVGKTLEKTNSDRNPTTREATVSADRNPHA